MKEQEPDRRGPKKDAIVEEVWVSTRDDIFALYRDRDKVFRVPVIAFGRVVEKWHDTGKEEEKILPLVMIRGGRLVPPYGHGGGLWVGVRTGGALTFFENLDTNSMEFDAEATAALVRGKTPIVEHRR